MVYFQVIVVIWDIVKNYFLYLFYFLKWFYLHFLPFVVIYIGIPLFIIGVLLGLSFGGGTVIFITVFAIGFYFFVKQVIFKTDPYKLQSNNVTQLSANQKIFKSNF